MRIILIIIFFQLASLGLFSQGVKESKLVYNKEIIYSYKVTHVSCEKNRSVNILYLVCYGTPWRLDTLNQIKVNWAPSLNDIFKKTAGTGVIENKLKIWMHPPRYNEFSILEYSPFPYVKFPLEIGRKWNWELALGKYWKNESLSVRADDIMKYIYLIEGHEKVKVNFSDEEIDSYKIISKSINERFDSSLTCYFNKDYGFVKLFYKNIDKSELRFELIDICFKENILNFDSVFKY